MKTRSFTRDDVYRVESVLLKDPVVSDCCVLAREKKGAGEELIAYIVSAGSFSLESLLDRLRTILPAKLIPRGYVPVSSLPHTASGLVDEQALKQLEVIDADLMRRWEERLLHLPGVEDVAVVVQECVKNPFQLHLSDLLPNTAWPVMSKFCEPEGLETQDVQSAGTEPTALAISDGGPLAIDEETPKTLADALAQTASRYSEKGLLVIRSLRTLLSWLETNLAETAD